eukprot:2037869-Amphidinium_carterae.1
MLGHRKPEQRDFSRGIASPAGRSGNGRVALRHQAHGWQRLAVVSRLIRSRYCDRKRDKLETEDLPPPLPNPKLQYGLYHSSRPVAASMDVMNEWYHFWEIFLRPWDWGGVG